MRIACASHAAHFPCQLREMKTRFHAANWDLRMDAAAVVDLYKGEFHSEIACTFFRSSDTANRVTISTRDRRAVRGGSLFFARGFVKNTHSNLKHTDEHAIRLL
jgi:hypothetical protein